MKKKVILVSAIVAVVLVGLPVGGGVVVAKNNASYPPVVKRLAERFNLQLEVNKVFTEVCQERWKERQVWLEQRLGEAVKRGEITEVEKDALLKKRAEIQNEGEKIRSSDLTLQEKWEKLSKLRSKMQELARGSGLDAYFCRAGFGPGAGRGRGSNSGGNGANGKGYGLGLGNCAGPCFRQ